MLNRLAQRAALLLFVSSLVPAAFAADDGYRHVLVAERIAIAVPDHWKSMDAQARANLAAYAASFQAGNHEVRAADLVVTSIPEPSAAVVRASLKPGTDISQAEFVREVREHPAEMLAAMREMHAELGKMKGPARVIGTVHSSFETIGGKLAMVARYRRTSPTEGSETYTVTQYIVPLGDKNAIFSLSRRDSQAVLWDPVLERVRKSIVIDPPAR